MTGSNLEVELVVSNAVSVRAPPCLVTSVDSLSERVSRAVEPPGNHVESQCARRIVSGAQGGDHHDDQVIIARRTHGIPRPSGLGITAN